MLINNEEVERRLSNPSNLMNRLRSGSLGSGKKNSAMSLFVPSGIKKEQERVEVSFVRSESKPTFENPFKKVPQEETAASETSTSFSASDIIPDLDSQVSLARAHDSAIELLQVSITKLKDKVEGNEIKVSSIPSVINSAGKIIEIVRKEKLEREKNNKDINVHHHFYCPEQKSIETYEVIEVTG